METAAGVWTSITDWWAGLPAVPDLDLPAPGDPDLMIVIATVLLALGLTALISAWIDRRRSLIAMLVTLLALAMVFWVWEADRDGFGWIAIPEAFVEMVARVLR